MSEHQWTILIIGAATIIGVCVGRILERVEIAREKRVAFERHRAWAQAARDHHHLRLHPNDTIPPAA